jgi:hypothetical protein
MDIKDLVGSLEKARVAADRASEHNCDSALADLDRADLDVFAIEDAILQSPATSLRSLAVKAEIALRAFDRRSDGELEDSLDYPERAALSVLINLCRFAAD